MYGLCDTPRALYLSVKEELGKAGRRKCKYADEIFYWYQRNKLEGILASHVVDFCWAGSKWFHENVINHNREKFLASREETETFKYL